jgi:hypothetical protein
MVEAMM